jgi:hypothetical protein
LGLVIYTINLVIFPLQNKREPYNITVTWNDFCYPQVFHGLLRKV